MKPIIAGLAAIFACLATSLPAAEPPHDQVFIYATYYRCNSVKLDKADEYVTRQYRDTIGRMIASHDVSGWGWLAHVTGGEWTRAAYIVGPNEGVVLAASLKVQPNIDHPPPIMAFDQGCGSGEDYIWHVLAGNEAGGHRGKAAFSTYFVCDQSREKHADELVTQQLAPLYDRLVAEHKLISWAWAEHIVGGKFRRLATMSAASRDEVLAARDSIVAAPERSALNDALASVCGSHEDYIWDIKDQGP